MSSEKVISTELNDLLPLKTPNNSEEVSSSGRVDINILLNRARKEKAKETRANLVFCRINSFFDVYCWTNLIFLITYFHI